MACSIKAGTYEHTYPFCWRCDTPLIYWAKTTWYIRTSAHKDRLVALNQEINWVPEHVKDGRFGNWLENNVDWALGRDRYLGHAAAHLEERRARQCSTRYVWAAAPNWPNTQAATCSDLDLHRPYVDEVTWPAPDGGTMRRVNEVLRRLVRQRLHARGAMALSF